MKDQKRKLAKSSAQIVESLINQHKFTPLKHYFLCQKFVKNALGFKATLIEKAFISKNTLTLITKNHIGFQELNHDDSKVFIKRSIKIFAQIHKEFEKIDNLRIFSKRYQNDFKNLKNEDLKEEKNSYFEPSLGKFQNHFKDKILFERFENLRKIIKNNLEKKQIAN